MINEQAIILKKYKRNYNLKEISFDQVKKHWKLEQHLTRQLLLSSKEERLETFQYCYTKLYHDLPWLNQAIQHFANFQHWAYLVGRKKKKIYEVGSGGGGLLSYLAKWGHVCRGSEITHLREGKEETGISWGITDGVHLKDFEPENVYDIVISDQVIEHLHPEDLLTHFQHAWMVLNAGAYIFKTPHRLTGPHDVSRIFGCKKSKGMHLKEYTYKELAQKAKTAGFRSVYFPLTKNRNINILSTYWLLFAEAVLSLIPFFRFRRFLGRILKKCRLFQDNITLMCIKD